MADPTPTLLWGGRFTSGMDKIMITFNESLPFDKVLYKADIQASIVYAKALELQKLLSRDEASKIIRGLQKIQEEWENGTFRIHPDFDEDIHTANERRLSELIGQEIGGKLHTGRSRNEQIATDLRIWLREELSEFKNIMQVILEVCAQKAEQEIDVLMPGYTHLQRAQPIRFSHWILSHATYIMSDVQRLEEIAKRVNTCPLGVGALSGNPFALDRNFMASELGFSTVHPNSLAAVADRDFVVETLQWASLVMAHLSRLSEDLIIYSTAEYGFVKIADAYSTGSSLMPQKKNPDSLELIRGKAGRVLGQSTGMVATIKSLPTAYNKDIQESIEPLVDCIRTVSHSLKISLGVLSTLTINKSRMQGALTVDMLATEVADYLVKKGVPFRQTHHIAGAVIKSAEDQGTTIEKLSLEQLRTISPLFEEDIAATFDFANCVDKRSSQGGTSKASVLQQAEAIRLWLHGKASHVHTAGK